MTTYTWPQFDVIKKASCLVTGDGAPDGVDVAEDKMGTSVVGFLGGVFHVSVVR